MPLRPVGMGFLISTLSDRYGSYCPNLKGWVTVRVMVACSMVNVSVCPQYAGKILNLPLGKDKDTAGPMTTGLPCTNAAARKGESGRHQWTQCVTASRLRKALGMHGRLRALSASCIRTYHTRWHLDSVQLEPVLCCLKAGAACRCRAPVPGGSGMASVEAALPRYTLQTVLQ